MSGMVSSLGRGWGRSMVRVRPVDLGFSSVRDMVVVVVILVAVVVGCEVRKEVECRVGSCS